MTALRAVRLISAMPWGRFRYPTRLRSVYYSMWHKNMPLCLATFFSRTYDFDDAKIRNIPLLYTHTHNHLGLFKKSAIEERQCFFANILSVDANIMLARSL